MLATRWNELGAGKKVRTKGQSGRRREIGEQGWCSAGQWGLVGMME